jgi:GNAT superfamily N-acetyltransferase
MRPHRVIVQPEDGPACLTEPPPAGGRCRWPVRRGGIGEFLALARFHYVVAPPAAHKRVWSVPVPRSRRVPGGPAVAAVLVVSPPVLGCGGRDAATAGRYRDRGGPHAGRINADFECISRVVVHPSFRGRGLAVRLVRHAIATAATPRVEALAAMGRVHPFFELAGMACHGRFGRPGRGYLYYLTPAPGGPEARTGRGR